jgi:uncharacterized damage-inducible protein DinB
MPKKQVQQAEWLLKAMGMAFQRGKGLWGLSLLDALEGLTAKQAAWKPRKKGARSIWEIVNHVTFWKDFVVRHLDSKSYIRAEDDWPEAGEVSEETWLKTVQRLKRVHNDLLRRLRAGRLNLDESCDLTEGWTAPLRAVLHGVIAHDGYHTGQILTLRQLQGIGP